MFIFFLNFIITFSNKPYWLAGLEDLYKDLNSKVTIMNLEFKVIANQIFDISYLFHKLLILFYYS